MKELLRKLIHLGIPKNASRKTSRSHGAVNLTLTAAFPTNIGLSLLYYLSGITLIGHYFATNTIFIGAALYLSYLGYRKIAVYVGLCSNLVFISLVGLAIPVNIGVGIVLLALVITMFTVFNFEEKLHLAISCGLVTVAVFCYLHFEAGLHGTVAVPPWLILTQRILSLSSIFSIMGLSLLYYEKLTEEIYEEQNQTISEYAKDLKAALLRSESLNSISTIFEGAFLDKELLHKCCTLLRDRHHYFAVSIVVKEAFDQDFDVKAYSSSLPNTQKMEPFSFQEHFEAKEQEKFLKVYTDNSSDLYTKTVQTSFGISETAICILGPIKHFGVLYICLPNEMKHYLGKEREFIDSVTKTLSMYFEKNEAIEEKMETYKSANRLKDDFLAKTSHELRTPLNGIIGLTEMLIYRHQDIGADSLRSLNLVKRSGERLLLLVNDLLDYARMRRKTITLDKTHFNILEAIESVFSILRKDAKQNNIRLNHDVADDAIMIFADKNRLNQVLTNLVHNAIQHTQNGKITVQVNTKEQDIYLEVCDNGKGMLDDAVKIAFEPFVRAARSKEEAHHGVGIGLNITKELVELHEGIIEIKSSLGQGTTISITLPEAKSNQKVVWAPSIDKPSRQNKLENSKNQLQDSESDKSTKDTAELSQLTNPFKKILVIDDNTTNLEVIRAQLDSLPYQTEFADSGKKAAQLIDSGFKPDLVLLDFEMPVMNGLETCKYIRSRFSPIEMPIVFITAYDADERLKQCFEAGANDYLRKPITQNTLLPRMDNLLRLSGLHQRSNQFVPWQALKMLGYESILDFKVGDFCERELAVLFTDIRDFTELADQMEAEDLMRFVTSYMSYFGPIIAKHGGHINKFLGDGMMAIFPNFRQGIEAGIDFSNAVDEYNRRYRSGSKRSNIKIGIAVHGSSMLFGVVGYASRADITAISKGVNLASRLEGMTKAFGAKIIVTEEVFKASQLDSELDFRYLGTHYLRGSSSPSKLIEIVPKNSSEEFRRRLQYKEDFETAVNFLDNKNFGKALDLLESLLLKYPEDQALDYLKKLCLEFYEVEVDFEVA